PADGTALEVMGKAREDRAFPAVRAPLVKAAADRRQNQVAARHLGFHVDVARAFQASSRRSAHAFALRLRSAHAFALRLRSAHAFALRLRAAAATIARC